MNRRIMIQHHGQWSATGIAAVCSLSAGLIEPSADRVVSFGARSHADSSGVTEVELGVLAVPILHGCITTARKAHPEFSKRIASGLDLRCSSREVSA